MTAPLTLRYFHPTGFFSGIGLTHVDQAIARPSSAETTTEEFVTLDTVIGYRFPKRLGIVTIAINNLLDEEFRFQDDNFRIFVPARTFAGGDLDLGTVSNIVPDRTILGVVTVSF